MRLGVNAVPNKPYLGSERCFIIAKNYQHNFLSIFGRIYVCKGKGAGVEERERECVCVCVCLGVGGVGGGGGGHNTGNVAGEEISEKG